MPDAERTKENASPALTFIQLVQGMLCTACWESQKESIFHPRLSNGKCKEGTMPDIIRIRTVRVPERKKKKKREREVRATQSEWAACLRPQTQFSSPQSQKDKQYKKQ